MLSSNKDGKHHDPSCVLEKGSHDFIDKPTHVVYRLANTVGAVHISNMVERKFYTPKDDMSDEVFSKVVTGFYASDETRPFAIEYAKKNGITAAPLKTT